VPFGIAFLGMHSGQWGSTLAFGTCLLDMECEVGEFVSILQGMKYVTLIT
jgi:hypothetical protein